ncbi:MAG: DNA primase [Prevotella sp.]|nr:DNA primase [Prevotella sp.]
MIDRQTIDRIMDAANIVDVVSDFVSLRKRGTSYKGLCPFHDDTTPSFSVSPAKGVYKCFACGKAGNVVNFIMEHEQLTYPDALRWLAKKYHIEIEERELTDEERKQQSERESMLIVNEWAADYFHDILLNDRDGQAIGLQYFRQRGFRDDIIERFKLGFCLNRRDAMAQEAKRKGYRKEFLVKTGLCYEAGENTEKGATVVDRFRGRVIFPWIGVGGKIIAFGGRLLDSRTKGVAQKYVNSPDSDIYHKDHELYGIFQAKKQIVKEDRVYMVEGYTDVISMHQCGIENVVANSGTALSIHQIKLLRRFTQNITLLYDGDEAGIHAAMRGTDMLLAEGMNIKVLLLPDQEDPDSFARKHTAADFKQYIEEHQTDFMQFKTDVMLKGVSDPIKRSEAISSIVKSISVIKDPIIRATYIKDCSQRIGIAEQTLITQMNRFIRDERNRQQTNLPETEAQNQQDNSQQQEAAQENVQRATAADIHFDRTNKEKILSETIEKLIVQSIVRYGEETIFHNVETEDGQLVNLNVIEYISLDLGADNLQLSVPLYNKILQEAVAHARDDDFKAETFFLHHPDMEISQLATTLSIDDYTLTDSMKVVHDEESLRNQVRHLILDFRMYHVEMKLRQMRQQLSAAINSTDDIMKLMQQIHELQERRNIYAKNLGNNIIT